MSYAPPTLPGLFPPAIVYDSRLFPNSKTLGRPVPSQVLSSLHDAMAGKDQAPREMLQRFAEAARMLTNATGVVVALRRNGKVVCLGRSGDTAPELGAILSENSGLSGLCMRAGKPLVCNETLTDARVDAHACQRIGVRSIAVVPLRVDGDTIGILEGFSTRAGAFTREHIDFLVHIAEVIETAGTVPHKKHTTQTARPAPKPVQTKVAPAQAELTAPAEERLTHRYRPVIAGMVVMMGIVAWAGWHFSPAASADFGTGAQAKTNFSTASPLVNEDQAGLTSTKPVAGSMQSPENLTSLSKELGPSPSQPQTSPISLPLAPAAKSVPTTTAATPSNPARPAVEKASLTTKVPQNLPPVEAVLEKRVPPVYPEEALRRGIHGTVVLKATVAENGTVESIQVTEGDPVLAKAAVAAAKRWRYRPFRVEGKAARAETMIQMKFQPQ